MVRTQAAWNAKKDALVLFALNLSGQPRTVSWDLAVLKEKFDSKALLDSLSSPNAQVSVTEAGPNPIVRDKSEIAIEANRANLTLKPFSATALHVRRVR